MAGSDTTDERGANYDFMQLCWNSQVTMCVSE